MRLRHLVARGFRNLADARHELPPRGLAMLGANAQGKSNFLEAVYYPVVFRSFRGVQDQAVAAFGGPGFQVEASVEGGADRLITTTWQAAGRRKRIALDEVEAERLAGAVGRWLAVVFLPSDLGLALGREARQNQTDPVVMEAIDRILAGAKAAGLHAGMHCTSAEYARQMVSRGFDFVTVTSDEMLLSAGKAERAKMGEA